MLTMKQLGTWKKLKGCDKMWHLHEYRAASIFEHNHIVEIIEEGSIFLITAFLLWAPNVATATETR